MIKIKLDGMCEVFGSVPNIVSNGYDYKSVGVGEGLNTRKKSFLHYLVLLRGEFLNFCMVGVKGPGI